MGPKVPSPATRALAVVAFWGPFALSGHQGPCFGGLLGPVWAPRRPLRPPGPLRGRPFEARLGPKAPSISSHQGPCRGGPSAPVFAPKCSLRPPGPLLWWPFVPRLGPKASPGSTTKGTIRLDCLAASRQLTRPPGPGFRALEVSEAHQTGHPSASAGPDGLSEHNWSRDESGSPGWPPPPSSRGHLGWAFELWR